MAIYISLEIHKKYIIHEIQKKKEKFENEEIFRQKRPFQQSPF